ncbi:MAG: hypothetical protein K6F50_06785 [Kiritimatiellae bacterium]|nr:hypothetical protein [Kiritimatiellia bacterium]
MGKQKHTGNRREGAQAPFPSLSAHGGLESTQNTERVTRRALIAAVSDAQTEIELRDIEERLADELQYTPEGEEREDADFRWTVEQAISARRAELEARLMASDALRLARDAVAAGQRAEADKARAEAETRGAIAAARAAAKRPLHQTEVAWMAGVARETIHNWEKAERAGTLDSTTAYVIEGDEHKSWYSARLREIPDECKRWCKTYKLQMANAKRARKRFKG